MRKTNYSPLQHALTQLKTEVLSNGKRSKKGIKRNISMRKYKRIINARHGMTLVPIIGESGIGLIPPKDPLAFGGKRPAGVMGRDATHVPLINFKSPLGNRASLPIYRDLTHGEFLKVPLDILVNTGIFQSIGTFNMGQGDYTVVTTHAHGKPPGKQSGVDIITVINGTMRSCRSVAEHHFSSEGGIYEFYVKAKGTQTITKTGVTIEVWDSNDDRCGHGTLPYQSTRIEELTACDRVLEKWVSDRARFTLHLALPAITHAL